MNYDDRRAWDQLLMARAFDGLGQLDSAVVLYQEAVRPGHWGASWRWLPIVYRRLGELCTDLGDQDAAAHYYNAFLELWSGPNLQPQVEAVRQALVQLTAEGAGAGTGACGQ